MLKDLKIKNKVILLCAVIMVLSSISGIYGLFKMINIKNTYNDALQNFGFAQGDVGSLLSCFASINVSVHDSVSYMNAADKEAAHQVFATQSAKMDGYFSTVEATLKSAEARNAFNAAKSAWNQYLPLAQQLMSADSTDPAAITALQSRLAGELDPLYSSIYTNLTTVMTSKKQTGLALEESISIDVNINVALALGLLLVSVLATLILGAKVSGGIAGPIEACARRLTELAGGDLHSEVPQYNQKDEVGLLSSSTTTIVTGLNTVIEDVTYLLEAMAKGNFNIRSRCTEQYIGDFQAILLAVRGINYSLSDALSQINTSSEQVSSGSTQVSSASQNLAQGATEQASSVQELAATVADISQQVDNNAENASTASEKAKIVGGEMEKSNEKMNQLTEAMSEINATSNEISKIMGTIENIAFQTNILALNAAVEAAKAGSTGAGFAVVANEVRALAIKSQEASKETAELIVRSSEAVSAGTKITGETAAALRQAVDGAKDVVTSVEKISEASGRQAESLSQVSEGIDQISAVVQTNSATAEQCAAASEELSSQAQLLKGLVSRFQLRHDKGAAASVSSYAPPPAAESSIRSLYDDEAASSKY